MTDHPRPAPQDSNSNPVPDIPNQVIEDLDTHSERTVMTALGVMIAGVLFVFACLLSHKIFVSFGSPNNGFALFFGIPLAVILFVLSYKSMHIGKGEFVEDADGEATWVVGKSAVLPKWLHIPLKIVATLIFGFGLYLGIRQRHVYMTMISLLLLLWTHYDIFSQRGWISENQAVTLSQNLVILLKFSAFAYLVAITLVKLIDIFMK